MPKPKQRQDLFEFFASPLNKKTVYEDVPVWYFLTYDGKTLSRRIEPNSNSYVDNSKYKPCVYPTKSVAMRQARQAREYGFSVDVVEIPSSEILYCGKKIID